MVTAIVKKSCPRNRDDLLKMQNVGFTEEFKLRAPMEQVRTRRQTAEERDEILRRMDIVLWDYQGRCPQCNRVREKEQLAAHGGLCEMCSQEN